MADLTRRTIMRSLAAVSAAAVIGTSGRSRAAEFSLKYGNNLPLSHPLFHAMFEVGKLPQITNIMFWRRNGGYTSERGEESKDVHFRAHLTLAESK